MKRRARKRTGPRLLPVVLSALRPIAAGIEILAAVGASRMHLEGAVTAEYLGAVIDAVARTC